MSARTALCLATLVASLGFALSVAAHDGPHDGDAAATQGNAAAAAAPDEPAPITRLDLVNARQRLDRAEAAHTRMLNRNFPRGDARVEIIQERDDARAEWDRLRNARPDIAKQLEGRDGG